MPEPSPIEPKPMMRRRGLNEWLTQCGFTIWQIDKLIADGVIPQTYFGLSGGERKNKRAYYNRDAVAAALRIPISPKAITTNTPAQ